MAERPFITCHVLDTTTGKPGKGIAVSLESIDAGASNNSAMKWTATTNDDGRVPAWQPSGIQDLNELVAQLKNHLEDGEQMMFELRFNVADYYGPQNTFWPEVVLRFAAKTTEQHYHVPLLLGPWSYTTYRGS